MVASSESASGRIPGNDFALPYVSTHSRIHDVDHKLLQHVNCGYLSTPGTAPTLEDLKRHAQSLCVLITQLTVTSNFTAVSVNSPSSSSSTSPGNPDFDGNNAFDWLEDLSTPYSNSNKTHQTPLNSLVNEVRSHHESLGSEYHCPLVELRPHVRKPGQAAMPYATHHNLVMHANSCLEYLDHEYGATGGLLSLLPPTDDDNDGEGELAAAKNTLLGQWLRYTQHLVGRMHELEIAYANALDTLAGEAVVPMQQVESGGDTASIEPQNKWILVNAGPDVLAYIHRQLDNVEARMDEQDIIWRNSGVAGARLGGTPMPGQDGDIKDGDDDGYSAVNVLSGVYDPDTHAKGIVPVTIGTRFYRLRGHANGAGSTGNSSPIFVVPAWNVHPAVAHTRDHLEKRPTVVSVVAPVWPERVSEFARRHQAQLDDASRAQGLHRDTLRLLAASEADNDLLQGALEIERARNEYAEAKLSEMELTQHPPLSGTGIGMDEGEPQNPVPLRLDNDNLRASIRDMQTREARYRDEIRKLHHNILDLQSIVKMGMFGRTDSDKAHYQQIMALNAAARGVDKDDLVHRSHVTPVLEGVADVSARLGVTGAVDVTADCTTDNRFPELKSKSKRATVEEADTDDDDVRMVG